MILVSYSQNVRFIHFVTWRSSLNNFLPREILDNGGAAVRVISTSFWVINISSLRIR